MEILQQFSLPAICFDSKNLEAQTYNEHIDRRWRTFRSENSGRA